MSDNAERREWKSPRLLSAQVPPAVLARVRLNANVIDGPSTAELKQLLEVESLKLDRRAAAVWRAQNVDLTSARGQFKK